MRSSPDVMQPTNNLLLGVVSKTLMSILPAALTVTRFRDSPSRPLPRSLEWLILGLLVLAAFAIRVYHLGSFPDTVLADEADNAQSAVRILYGQPPANGFF